MDLIGNVWCFLGLLWRPWSHRMNCRVDRSDPDAAVAPRRYGLDPLLPTPGYHSMSGMTGGHTGRNHSLGSGRPAFRSIHSWVGRSRTLQVWERSWSGKAKTAPRIWVARGRLCPDGGTLWGRAQPNRDSTPPTSSAPLYRLNHSKSLVGGTGEPRELVRCVGQRARSTPFSWSSLFFASVVNHLLKKEAGLHALFETTKAGGGLFH